jgi:adenylate cyclase
VNPSFPRPRSLRLASGLVLFAYAATHLLNHAVGLVSLAAAEAVREGFVAFWRNPLATAAFYGSLLLHIGLALAALYERRTLRMPALEAARIALGFAIPLLLAFHIAATRLTWEIAGVPDTYTRVAAMIWGSDSSLRQLTLIVVVWLHGCFGLHLAYRHRAAWQRWQSALIALATLVPTLGFTGYLAMAREAPAPSAAMRAASDAGADTLRLAGEAGFYTPLALLAFVLAARALQLARARRSGRLVRIRYPGRSVEVPPGFSVLEASREFGIPHLSLCGGRARCSTCRVRVVSSAQGLPAPEGDEARTLARIGAGTGVRLACQLRPTSEIEVQPLMAARVAGVAALEVAGAARERDIVVLFSDLRRWTTISERQLPFDLVYVLDRYFEAVGDAVREAGGIPNQFIGDSVMALFGVDGDRQLAARQALDAAARIEQRMAVLNESLVHEFGRPLDFGIGIHAGTAAIATVGYRETRSLSAVGDAVNTASRLQEMTKLLGARLVVSQTAFECAGSPPGEWERHEVPIRGREGSLVVFARRSAAPAEPVTTAVPPLPPAGSAAPTPAATR